MGNDVIDAVDDKFRGIWVILEREATLYSMNEENLDNVEVPGMLNVGL
jgi:hypothetical protein